MRRGLSVLFMAGLIVMTLDSMAQAKPGEGDSDVTVSVAISGPGLSGPVTLDRSASTTYEDLSNVFSPTARMHVRPGAVNLGPRFSLLFTLACTDPAGIDTVSIHQDLYPYASYRGQPQVWTYTPAGQGAFCRTADQLAAGWNATRRGLFDTLAAAGLPSTAPVTAPVPVPVSVPAPAPHPFWPVVWLVAAFLTLLLVAVVAGRPRRKARVLG